MYSFRAVLIFVCVSFAVILASENEPIYKTFVHSGNEKVFTSPRVFEDGSRYVSASCNDSKLASELNCIVTTDKLETFDVKNCPLRKTLPANKRLKSDNFDLKLYILGNPANIVVFWDEVDPTSVRHFKGAAIMNMTSCKPKFLDLFPYPDVPIMHIVVYNDTFDVITFDEPRVCDSMKRCRVTFNSQGEQIGNPQAFPIRSKDISIYPKFPSFSSGSFYIFDWEQNEVSAPRIQYLNSDDQITELDISGVQYKKHPAPAVSIGHERMTIYGWKVPDASSNPSEMAIIRTRIDTRDNEELGLPPLYFNESQDVKTIAAYNLPHHHQHLYAKIYTTGDERKIFLDLEFHEIGSEPLNMIKETFNFATSGYIQDLKAFITEEEQGYCLYFSSIYVLGSTQERFESTLKYYKKCVTNS